MPQAIQQRGDDSGSCVFQKDLIVQALEKKRYQKRGPNTFLYSPLASVLGPRLCGIISSYLFLKDDTTSWRSRTGQVEIGKCLNWLVGCWYGLHE